MTSGPIQTHKELESTLQESMRKTYQGAQARKTDEGHVKSFLAEAHLHREDAVARLQKIVARGSEQLGKDQFHFQRLRDKTLFLIETWQEGLKPAQIYVDTRNPRFWRLHTTSLSTKVDIPLEKLVGLTSKLDRVWLAEDFLRRIGGWGEFRGFKVLHERLQFDTKPKKRGSHSPRTKSFKLSSGSDLSDRLLEVVKGDSELQSFSSISGLSLKYGETEQADAFSDDNEELAFSIDDVVFNGKFRSRGTSIDSHLELLRESLRMYSGAIKKIEDCAITHGGLKGEPCILKFSDSAPIKTPDAFCEFVFSAEKVFKLFGVPERIGPDAFRVEATDIHSGGSLQVDVFPTFLKFYLFEDACGNSLLRFYANLQRYQDAQVTLRNHVGEIFDFFDVQ